MAVAALKDARQRWRSLAGLEVRETDHVSHGRDTRGAPGTIARWIGFTAGISPASAYRIRHDEKVLERNRDGKRRISGGKAGVSRRAVECPQVTRQDLDGGQ